MGFIIARIIIAVVLFFCSFGYLSIYGDKNIPAGLRNKAGWLGWLCSVSFGVVLMVIFG